MAGRNARFSGILPPKLVNQTHALIVGCGGIGSYTALLMAKMGVPSITLVDDDTVEMPNVGTQLYSIGDRGRPKVLALADILNSHSKEFGDKRVKRYTASMLELSSPTAIIVAAVDNIETRRDMWNDLNNYIELLAAEDATAMRNVLFIDPRMSLEFMEVNALPLGIDCKPGYNEYSANYNATVNDLAAKYDEEPCGASALPGTGMFAAHAIMSTAIRWWNNEEFPYLLRSSLGDEAFTSVYYPREPEVRGRLSLR